MGIPIFTLIISIIGINENNFPNSGGKKMPDSGKNSDFIPIGLENNGSHGIVWVLEEASDPPAFFQLHK